jgi:hypothetical protein
MDKDTELLLGNQSLDSSSNSLSNNALVFPRVNISSPTELHRAWINFLHKYPWCWFATLTFKNEIHPEQANRRFYRYIRKINKTLFGNRYYEKGLGIMWTKAIEYQKRGVIHFHALLGPEDLNSLNHFDYMELWHTEGNGFARIYPYSPEKAEWYVTKYVVKGGEIDLDFPPSYKDRESMQFLSLER